MTSTREQRRQIRQTLLDTGYRRYVSTPVDTRGGYAETWTNPEGDTITLDWATASEPEGPGHMPDPPTEDIDLVALEHVSNFTRMRLTDLGVEALFGDEDGEHHYEGRKLEVSACHKCGSVILSDMEEKHAQSHILSAVGLGGLLG